jgi:sec-independent protein translocase protein TatA
MPNIGAPELIIILVIALLILGPGKLPEVGASLGKTIREFRKASADVQESVKLDTPAATSTPAQAPTGPADAGSTVPETYTQAEVEQRIAAAVAAAKADPAPTIAASSADPTSTAH